MMVRTRPSVSSSILVILACLWGCIGAESLRANFLDNILADLSQDYQQLEYGDALDYNDIGLMSQYGPEDRNDADAGSFKQDNENQKPAKESAYCDPPNPCPKGYTAEDGCIEMEEFENKADFSRKYQSSQNCMCDSEHMFSCPDPDMPPLHAMYKDHQTEDMPLLNLPGLDDINNPYLTGSKLPIAAKKGMGY